MSATLPAEIIELIIHETWKLPLTNNDRLVFMKTSLRISSAWLFAFLRESLTDIHFVSRRYSYYLTMPYRLPRQPPQVLTINTTRFVLPDYLAHHCRSITLGSTADDVKRADFIVRNLRRCPRIGMVFRNYAQHLPYWLCINVQGLFAKALKLKDGHLRLIFTYDTSDVDYSPRDRYGYASEQHFYYPMAFGAAKRRPWDPFTGVRRLEIRGANPCAVFMTVEVCPDLEVLETDVDEKIIRAGFDVANTRPPASCPEEVYFFSNYNWHHPTEEMQWPNRRRNASAEKSAQPPYVLPSGAENLPSMRIIRQRKSIQSSENTLPHSLTQ